MAAAAVLGLPEVRAAFLDDASGGDGRPAEACRSGRSQGRAGRETGRAEAGNTCRSEARARGRRTGSSASRGRPDGDAGWGSSGRDREPRTRSARGAGTCVGAVSARRGHHGRAASQRGFIVMTRFRLASDSSSPGTGVPSSPAWSLSDVPWDEEEDDETDDDWDDDEDDDEEDEPEWIVS